MSEPKIIQRQREFIRAFLQATEERTKAEKEADSKLARMRSVADDYLSKAREAEKTAESSLARVGETKLLRQVRPSQPAVHPDSDPLSELKHSASLAAEMAEKLDSKVEQLEKHRAVVARRRKLALKIAPLVAVVCVVVVVLLVRAAYKELQRAVLYHSVIKAINAEEWNEAAGLIVDLNELRPNYRNIPELLAGHPKLRNAVWSAYTEMWLDSSGNVIAKNLKAHESDVNAVAFSPDGRLLASGNDDRTVKLWDVSSGKEMRTLKGHEWVVNAVAFSPDGRLLASGSGDYTVKLWDAPSGKEVRTLRGHKGAVKAIAFSPDGHFLASGSGDGTVRLWDVSSGKEVRTLKGHSGPVYAVAFSPDGRLLASGSDDNTVKLWDVSSGKEVRTLKGHEWVVNAVAFSPDGRLLASGGGYTVKLWSVSSRK